MIAYSSKFDWDEKKNASNYLKHKVWFEEAQTVWADKLSLEFNDPDSSLEEERFLRIGHSTSGRLLMLVFCERQEGKVTRIISARKTTRKEKDDYEKAI